MAPDNKLHGLAAGDAELVLNVIDDPQKQLIQHVQGELNFDGFVGPKGDVLPRLQNMQATVNNNVMPAYRNPGDYSGEEWETFPWHPMSRRIKEAVE